MDVPRGFFGKIVRTLALLPFSVCFAVVVPHENGTNDTVTTLPDIGIV